MRKGLRMPKIYVKFARKDLKPAPRGIYCPLDVVVAGWGTPISCIYHLFAGLSCFGVVFAVAVVVSEARGEVSLLC